MKTGISMITCDRPIYLENTIISLGNISDCLKVLIDNGTTHKNESKAIAEKYGFSYVDGNRSNQAHGQNISFGILKKSCDYIFKIEDDLVFDLGYLDGLVSILDTRENVAACSGICWASMRTCYLDYINDAWETDDKSKFSLEQIACYRHKKRKLLYARHLHGAMLGRTKDIIDMEEKTKSIRGGIFNEHLSKVSGKEETEYSLLLRQICKKDLIVDSGLNVYHEYAPGGTRNYDVGKLVNQDVEVFLKTCRQLGVDVTTSPSIIGFVE